MDVDTAQFAAIQAQLADQADALAEHGALLAELLGRTDAWADALASVYRHAGEPVPDALRRPPRDRHGLHLVTGEAS